MKRDFLFYSVKKHKVLFILVIVIAIILLFMTIYCHNSREIWFNNYIDPFISIATFLVALIIWGFQIHREWINSLPKRITVHFVYEKKYVMSCFETWLASESDIRQWSQQIGGQMSKLKNQLSFYPYISSKAPTPVLSSFEKINRKKITIQLYEVTFHLKECEFKDNPRLEKDYLVWIDNNDLSDKNIEVWIDGHPDKPITALKAHKISKAAPKNSN